MPPCTRRSSSRQPVRTALRSAALATLLASSGTALPDELPFAPAAFPLEHCLAKLLRSMPATVLSVERELKMGAAFYEFEVRARADGLRWEVECNADTGEIVRIERDVAADDPSFRAVALVSRDEAVRIAATEVAGRPVAIEYEMSPEGVAWYEITLKRSDGATWEVMVDARSGAVLDVDHDEGNRTLFRIGPESD